MELYNVFLSPKAQRDLDSIYTYIAGHLMEPDTAEKLVGRLEKAILSLDRFPNRCPLRCVGAYANKGYRQLFAENYTIVFRVSEPDKQVLVVTVRYSPSQF